MDTISAIFLSGVLFVSAEIVSLTEARPAPRESQQLVVRSCELLQLGPAVGLALREAGRLQGKGNERKDDQGARLHHTIC